MTDLQYEAMKAYTEKFEAIERMITDLADALQDHAMGLQPEDLTPSHLADLHKVEIDIDNATRYLTGMDR